MGVVVRRYIYIYIYIYNYIDLLILLIPIYILLLYLFFFGAASLLFVHFKMFFVMIMVNIVRKCRFSRSLFGNFSCADNHWNVILDLKSAFRCRCISK